jgi:hypothetical protein
MLSKFELPSNPASDNKSFNKQLALKNTLHEQVSDPIPKTRDPKKEQNNIRTSIIMDKSADKA